MVPRETLGELIFVLGGRSGRSWKKNDYNIWIYPGAFKFLARQLSDHAWDSVAGSSGMWREVE